MIIIATLTIFTPTYNRESTLERLYESLKKQTNNDFIWYIIDDGSTDNTEQTVTYWLDNTKRFSIIYEKQSNQGKQNAHNTAVNKCNTELFFCVDSDDYLTENAVEEIISIWNKEPDKQKLSGILSLRSDIHGKLLGGDLPETLLYGNLTDLNNKYKLGDTALIFKTSVLKMFPFEVETKENFIPEEYSYIQIDQKYSQRVLHKIIYVCEYQNDGYTANVAKNLKNNPRSYIKDKKLVARLSKTLKGKIIAMAGYIAMCIYVHEKKIIFKSGQPLLCIMTFPLGIVNYVIRFKNRK